MKHHSFKRQWRQDADAYARMFWYSPTMRCFDSKRASKEAIANLAAALYRYRLSFAYGEALRHPRSRKAMEQTHDVARQLAQVGLWLLDHKEATL